MHKVHSHGPQLRQLASCEQRFQPHLRRGQRLGIGPGAAGDQQVIIAIGGSATVDGGIGILQALGARFLDTAGNELPDLPERLTELHTIDTGALLKISAAIMPGDIFSQWPVSVLSQTVIILANAL